MVQSFTDASQGRHRHFPDQRHFVLIDFSGENIHCPGGQLHTFQRTGIILLGDKDRYGRLLRYVYLEDGTFVNAKLIQDGYANVYDKFPISKLDEFRQYYREARENRRGLWGDVDGLKSFDK